MSRGSGDSGGGPVSGCAECENLRKSEVGLFQREATPYTQPGRPPIKSLNGIRRGCSRGQKRAKSLLCRSGKVGLNGWSTYLI